MAGETALARQLKKLAVPQTSVLIQDKIRKSFLFDHRDAAGLDREVVFAFGTTGLQKLCTINPLFAKFESDLFSLSYKDFQRSVQDANINKKLDDKISEFLRLVSPYFLLRDAHEALEWLVYRFQINLYNVDDLIASAIPHYNTSTFVRVVQLLDLDERSRWFWLKPIQKTGVCLEYSAVLNRFLSDGGFRKFICDIASNVMNAFKGREAVATPIMSFSMFTIYNALEKCNRIENSLITSLFPYILNGLKSDFKKYTSASYLIVSKIMLKVTLTSEIVETLLIKIFQMLKDDLVTEAFEILALAFQTQTIKMLPKKVFSVFLSESCHVNILFHIINDNKSSSLARAFIKRAILKLNTATSAKSKKGCSAFKFLKKFLNNVVLDEKCVRIAFNTAVKKIVKCMNDGKSKQNKKPAMKVAKCVFQCLELKYPEFFDKTYKKFLGRKSNKKKTLLCKLINNSVCCVKYEVAPNMKTCLALGLYHVNSEIRKTSVAHLLQLISSQKFTDNQFVEDSLYDRLLDDNPDIVLEILSSFDIVLQVLSAKKLIIVFESIFVRPIKLKSKWYNVQISCLNIIIMLYKDADNIYDIIELLIPFFFPVNKHTLAGFKLLLNSGLKGDLFAKVKQSCWSICNKEDITDNDIIQINCLIVSSLNKFISNMSKESKMVYASLLNSKVANSKQNSFLVFYIYAMQFILETTEDRSNYLLFLNDFLLVLKFCFAQDGTILEKFEILEDSLMVQKCVDSLNMKRFPSSLIYYAFYKIVTSPSVEINCESWPLVSNVYEDTYEILSNMFNFCIIHLNTGKTNLQEYFLIMLSLLISHHLKTVQATFWFLSKKLVNPSEILFVQNTAVSLAIALCKGQVQMNWLFENQIVFFSIIKTIGSSYSNLSQSALFLLQLCVKIGKGSAYPLKCLGDEIVKRSEEIKTDFRQCPESVGNWLKAAVDYTDAKKSLKVSKEMQSKLSVFDGMLSLLTKEEVPYSVEHFVLLCLQNIDSVTVLKSCIPMLYNHIKLLETASSDKNIILDILHLLIQMFTPKMAASLTEESDETKALLRCLNFSYNAEDTVDRNVQEFTLGILSNSFFSAIKSVNIQLEIFKNLLTLYMKSSLGVHAKVEAVLRELCPYAYLFLKHLNEKELTVAETSTLREAKRMKVTTPDSSITPENSTWEKITILLELLQGETNLLKKEILIPELFTLLQKSINYEDESSAEYIKQLILSAIHNCYEELSSVSRQKFEHDFRVEIVTLCIRTSTNPKTHHQAFLLLNLAATMFPDRVLENVMSIFVFMGSNLVRQDDSYSFQVLSQIIETIMPSLLEASNQQTKTDGYQVVASVIRVFVDSLLDIPGHRQLPLFTKVITTLDPAKYLWIPLGQICDQHATAFPDITADASSNWKLSPTLEFAVSFHQQFPPDIQIDTCINLIKFLSMLPDTKKQLETNPDEYKKIEEPFNLETHNNKQLQIYKRNILCYLKLWLSSHAFRNQVAELSPKQQHNFEEKYELLLESVLGFLQSRLNVRNIIQIDEQIQLLYDLVYAVNSLLPCNLFIKVVRQLLKNTGQEIQLRAIELLNTKLEQQHEALSAANHKPLLKLIRSLVRLIGTSLNSEEKNVKDILLQQTALYSLHLMCKLIGSDYQAKFFKVLNIAITILTQEKEPELMVNALLCIAQLCCCLNVSILPHLNSFMPTLIHILSDKKFLNLNDSLVAGIVAAMNSVIENLGAFLSSYMEDIVINICYHSVNYSEMGKKALSEKFVNLQAKIATEIPLRVLLNVIANSYSKLSHKHVTCVVPLMEILKQNLDSSKYDDILSSANELQTIYLSLLDFRNINQSISVEIVSQVESSIISCLQSFVLKLSVTRFRTFFQKIYQWAVISNDDQEQKFRIFTFYELTSHFSKSLKSLFSVMSKYLFTHASTALDTCNISKSECHYFDTDVKLSHRLLTNILDTLNYSFLYSEENLLDKEHFELLMHPLVNQIENLHDESMYQELIENHLKSCIAHFMSSVSDGALWKSANYQILLRTRHDSAKMRFGALQVVLEVVNKMGDNYLILLPESIPFLAELMEDESTEVEQECQTVIMEMEKTLGEPIRNYF